MTIAVLLDLLVVTLLVVTIVYATILNRRLGALRAGKEELRALINDFTAATERAHIGMKVLRQASEDSSRALNEKLDEAGALKDDLSFLVERGGVIADRLEHGIRGARGHQGPAPFTAAPERVPAGEPGGATNPSASLRKILEAMR